MFFFLCHIALCHPGLGVHNVGTTGNVGIHERGNRNLDLLRDLDKCKMTQAGVGFSVAYNFLRFLLSCICLCSTLPTLERKCGSSVIAVQSKCECACACRLLRLWSRDLGWWLTQRARTKNTMAAVTVTVAHISANVSFQGNLNLCRANFSTNL